jgi:hypothetical protein
MMRILEEEDVVHFELQLLCGCHGSACSGQAFRASPSYRCRNFLGGLSVLVQNLVGNLGDGPHIWYPSLRHATMEVR